MGFFEKLKSGLKKTKDALLKVKDDIAFFANKEGLDAHAKSALIRFED